MILILSIVLAFIVGCGFSMSCIAKSVKRGMIVVSGKVYDCKEIGE